MSATLVLSAVAKRFMGGANTPVRALDGISLDLEEGDFVSVIGSNGAGKSTLLRAITGQVPVDGGRITLDGRDITRDPVHRRAASIGRIAQDPQDSICASMSIAENLAMARLRGRARGLRVAVTARFTADIRDRVAAFGLGLEDRLDAAMGLLSGGQRQAIALLMATLAGTRLLLLDEHLAALDPRTARMVMELTGRLIAAERMTTLMVTHDMGAAIAWGNRLVMMHQGRIIFAAGGADKAALTMPGLVERFHAASGQDLADDRVLLAR